ncbi:MAG: response regulator [Bacteroidia bacterium]|jgi:two-component system sensor histidine kinase/response regulator
MDKPAILYIDDEEANVKAFEASFRREFDITATTSLPFALDALSKKEFQVVICDQKMPGVAGTEFLLAISAKYPKSLKVILTAYQDFQVAREALNSGRIFKYMLKPWDRDEIIQTVNLANELYNLRNDRERLIEELLKVKDQMKTLQEENQRTKADLLKR